MANTYVINQWIRRFFVCQWFDWDRPLLDVHKFWHQNLSSWFELSRSEIKWLIGLRSALSVTIRQEYGKERDRTFVLISRRKKKRKIQIKCLTENMSIINTKKVKLIVCKKNFSFSYDQNLLVLFNFKFFKRVWK